MFERMIMKNLMIYMNIHMDLKIVHDLHYYFFYVTFSCESWNVLRLIVSIWYLFEWALWFHEFFFSTPPPSAILSVCYSKNLVGDCRSSFLYVIWKKCRLTWIQLTNISIQVDILLKNTPVCWQQVDSRVTYFLTAK